MNYLNRKKDISFTFEGFATTTPFPSMFASMGAIDTVIRPGCECLVDQDKTIGGDPVGHLCRNNAEGFDFLGGQLIFICSSCHRREKAAGRLDESIPSNRRELQLAKIKSWEEFVKTEINSHAAKLEAMQ